MANQMQLLNLLVEESKDLIWIINGEFQLVYANKKYQTSIKRLTGKEHNLYSSAFLDFFDDSYFKKWKSYYTKALAGEAFEVEENHYDSQSNQVNYGLITLDPLRDADNKVIAVSCHSKDITPIIRKRSEADELMNASLDVFCTINEQGKFVFVSAAAKNHWGYAPEELIGKAYIDFAFEDDIPKSIEIANAIMSGQEIKSFSNRYKKKNGDIAYNLWSGKWDDSRKLMFCVARDAKEKIREEKELQKFADDLFVRNKDLEQFGYVVSHNLRSPVANIIGLATILETETEDADTVKRCAQDLCTSVNRLDTVIKDLSMILSIKDGSVELTKENIDLTAVLNTVLVDLTEIIDLTRTNIQVPAETYIIHSHKAYLYSVFYNLISNAIKYRSLNPPEINITFELNKESLVITVTDNGIGIDTEKHADELFKPYKRFNQEIEGKGLGLFLVKSHVLAIHGRIYLESEVGKGSTFTIILPRQLSLL